jgi:hypothetical protein
MHDLDRFQLPHDPNSVHQLHWKPGAYGKGIIEDDGTVHTWAVGERLDGDPSHRRYMMEKGLGDPYPDRGLQDHTVKFWIKPEGEVEILPDWGAPKDNHYDQIMSVDPRLTKATDSFYHFADMRGQDRVMHDPPKVVGAYQPASPEAVKRNAYNGRAPFVYDGSSNTVYVGKAGWHHDTLRGHRGIHGEQSYEGYITSGLEDHPVETQRWPTQVEWTHYDRTPANHEEVLDAVSQHVGLPAAHADTGWKFGTSSEELVEQIMQMFPPIPQSPPDPELEAKRTERAADPLGYEIRNDWNRPGDVQDAERLGIEWVPTHALKPFLEYDRRPGGKDSWNNEERWNALGEHLKTHGFRNPVWIDFNPDESTGHLSEGNHRVQLALDHGIPAVPVRVYRSRRTSPTQVKVTPKPEPQWEDSYDPTGYHYPDYLRPSHIGLPTVPPPGQHEAKLAFGRPMYHVAPTHARDAIMQQGLVGHDLSRVRSPWQQELGQPPGNYLFDNEATARSYVATLAAKTHGSYPGDTHGESFYDAGIYPNKDYGEGFAYVSPAEQEPPEGFYDWPDDKQEEWYEQEHERRDNEAEPYDHENPEHRTRLPANLQGWDIWRVNANGLPITLDPEDYLGDKQWRHRLHPEKPELRPKTPDDLPDEDEWEDTTAPRWMTHEHVPPERVGLHDHVPAWAVNDEWAENAHDEAGEHEVPSPLTLLHPRHVLPKGKLPPEAREIWGRHLGAYGDSQYDPEKMEWNDFEYWEPGAIGKGLVYMHPEFKEPELLAWQVKDWGDPSDDGYHHEDMVERFGLNGYGGDVLATIPDIQPDGTFSIIADGRGSQEYAEIVERLDPRMRARDKNRWNFG